MTHEQKELYGLPDHLRYLAFFTTILEATHKDKTKILANKLEELYEETIEYCFNNNIKLSIVFPQKEYKETTNEN
jgi:hypothetical protein